MNHSSILLRRGFGGQVLLRRGFGIWLLLCPCLSAQAQQPTFHNALRLDLGVVRGEQQALEYERRLHTRFAAVLEAAHRKHDIAQLGTYHWEYLENVEIAGTTTRSNFKGKIPAQLGDFVPDHTMQLSAGMRWYATQGRARLFVQPMLSYFRHWGFRLEDERELVSQSVSGCCPPGPLEVTLTQSQWLHERRITPDGTARQHWGSSLHLGMQMQFRKRFQFEMRLAPCRNWAVPFQPSKYYGSKKIGYRLGMHLGMAF